MFGVPLGQCVDLPSTRKRSVAGLAATTATGIENIPGSQTLQDDLLLSPVTKASRSDSRASFGSVQEGRFAGSTESLFDFRRQSLGLSSQSSVLLDSLSVDEVRAAFILFLLFIMNLSCSLTLGDFKNISTISIFLLAVAPYNFDTKMV